MPTSQRSLASSFKMAGENASAARCAGMIERDKIRASAAPITCAHVRLTSLAFKALLAFANAMKAPAKSADTSVADQRFMCV